MDYSKKDELVITTTNIKHSTAEKYDVDLSTCHDAGMVSVDSKEDVQSEGVYVEAPEDHKTHKYIVYTATSTSPADAYDSLDDADIMACFWDGYKRKKINSPDAVSVKASLGIVEASKAQAERDATFQRCLDKNIPEDVARTIAYNR